MKAKLLFVLATVALLFTACGKEKPTGKNELVFNGETHKLNSSANINHSQYFCSGFTEMAEDADHPAYAFDCYIYENSLNETYDLTKGPIMGDAGYKISFTPYIDWSKMFWLDNWNGTFGGGIGINNGYDDNETLYENTSVFKSGTMTIAVDNDALSLKLSGVLKNDDTISVELYVPKNEFVQR